MMKDEDAIKAVRRSNGMARREEIILHGRPVSMRTTVARNRRKYRRCTAKEELRRDGEQMP